MLQSSVSIVTICGLILLCALLNAPNVIAQTTTITNVTYTRTALYDIDTATTNPPLAVNATVGYAGANTGYYLAAGVFDLDDGNLVSGLGSSRPQSCATTTQLAGCIIPLTNTAGSERMQFLLSHPKGVWNLALVVAILDNAQNIIATSFSDYTFTITVHSALTLEVDVPNGVPVSVDGVNGTGGSVQLALAAGNHFVSVPNIVQVNQNTRIEFRNWSDGSTAANRSVALNYDIVLHANYVTQYKLQVISLVSVGGGGWYDTGSNVTLSIQSPITPMNGILGILGARWVLQSWTEDGQETSESTIDQITMNSPHVVYVIWNADYRLPLSIVSGLAILLALTLLYSRGRSRKQKRTRRGRSRKSASSGRGKSRLPKDRSHRRN
ncbi:MAG: hypothetical protein ACLP9D_15620 [Candidatus Bathyarchaeia archaeon]